MSRSSSPWALFALLGVSLALAEACASGGESAGSGGSGARGGSGGAAGGTSGAGGTAGMAGMAGAGGSRPIEDGCPGKLLVVASSAASVDGELQGLQNDLTPYCLSSSEDGADAVHRLEIGAAGTLRVVLESNSQGFRPVVWVQRGQCSELSAAVSCQRIQPSSAAGGSGASGGASAGTGGEGANSAGGSSAAGGAGGAGGTSAAGGAGGTSAAGGAGGTSAAGGAGGAGGSGGAEQGAFGLDVSSGETVFVIIDGAGGFGDYRLSAAITPARCGDGTRNPGEECDPGDGGVWAGCTPSCLFETPQGDDHCGGGPVLQFGLGSGGAGGAGPTTPESLSGSGHTTGYGNIYQGCGSGNGPDAVLTFLDHRPGTLEFTVVPSGFDAVLMAFNSCASQALSGQVSCSDADRSPKEPESVSFPITPNVAHHVVIDGYEASDWGSYTWTAQFLPSGSP